MSACGCVGTRSSTSSCGSSSRRASRRSFAAVRFSRRPTSPRASGRRLGCVPDERDERDGGRLRRRAARAAAGAPPAWAYCGEWIESHALHVYMLHAPDFLGYDGAVELARDDLAAVERGLQLKKTGNYVLSLVGGREIHPINVRVGGFYRAPTPRELRTSAEPPLNGPGGRARDRPLDGRVRLPERAVERELVALAEPGGYAIERGRVVSDRGLDVAPAEYHEHFVEEHVERSNALHSRRTDGGTYLCGPLARYALSGARSRRSRWRRRGRRASSRRVETPSAASSCAASNSSTPATRRSA